MRKQKSTRETKNMIQTALWLPRDMHEKLKNEGGERGFGDEIRRRLQITFDDEGPPVDATTRQLLEEIEWLTLNMLPLVWHADHEAFEVFRAGINEVLSSHRPSSEVQRTVAPGPTGKLQTIYGPDAKPETVGRILGVTGTYHGRQMAQSERERVAKRKRLDTQKE
jgi:hypothetical protein